MADDTNNNQPAPDELDQLQQQARKNPPSGDDPDDPRLNPTGAPPAKPVHPKDTLARTVLGNLQRDINTQIKNGADPRTDKNLQNKINYAQAIQRYFVAKAENDRLDGERELNTVEKVGLFFWEESLKKFITDNGTGRLAFETLSLIWETARETWTALLGEMQWQKDERHERLAYYQSQAHAASERAMEQLALEKARKSSGPHHPPSGSVAPSSPLKPAKTPGAPTPAPAPGKTHPGSGSGAPTPPPKVPGRP